MAALKATFLAAITLTLLLGSAHLDENTTNLAKDTGCVKVIEASNIFGLRLYLELSERHHSFAICPLSLSSALGMVYFGSRGNLAHELNMTLGFDLTSLEETELLDAYQKTLQVLNIPHAEYQLTMANSMWVQKSFQVEGDFKDIVSQSFSADVEEVDFNYPNATAQINQWANDHTNGKIPSLFTENLDSRIVLLLLNAVYFKGTWATQFDKRFTYPGKFYNRGGPETADVQMMSVSSSFRYYYSKDMRAEMVELPYAGQETSMLIILPNKSSNLTTFEDNITPHDLYSFISNMTEHKVTLTLPRFKLDQILDMVAPLSAMGLPSLFSNGDLGGISRKNGLLVSDVFQKTIVEVNEEGTEAAAATSMIFSKKKSSGERVMVVNRPFMFIIGHIPSGSMLFLGRVDEL